MASCDRQDGWYPIAVEQKCWKLFPAAVQRDAVRRCEDAGAELIVFQSQEKIDAFGDLVQDSSTGTYLLCIYFNSEINLNMETYKLVAELVLILNFCFLSAIKLKVTKVGY